MTELSRLAVAMKMPGSQVCRRLTWTVAGLPQATVGAAGASTTWERAADCVEK